MNDTYVDFCPDFKVGCVFPMVLLPESRGQYTDDHREDAHHLFLCRIGYALTGIGIIISKYFLNSLNNFFHIWFCQFFQMLPIDCRWEINVISSKIYLCKISSLNTFTTHLYGGLRSSLINKSKFSLVGRTNTIAVTFCILHLFFESRRSKR